MKKQVYVNNEYVESLEEIPYTLEELNSIMDGLVSSMVIVMQKLVEIDTELENLDPDSEEYYEVDEARDVLLAERERIENVAADIETEIKRLQI